MAACRGQHAEVASQWGRWHHRLVRPVRFHSINSLPSSASRYQWLVVLSGNEEIALRLGTALVLGSALGLNRELHGKPAGLRTHALVTLGAAVATLVALRSPNVSMAIDPNAISRIVQGILTGVGFLGAGVILRDPSGHVTGLTTASTIWICAVLGIVCGLGYWLILAIALALTLFALFFGKPIERFAERCFKHRHDAAPGHE